MEKKSEALSESGVEGDVQVQGGEARVVELGEVSRETRGGFFGSTLETGFTVRFP